MDAVESVSYGAVVARAPSVATAGRYWTLTLLVLVATVSMVDKALITVVLDPIKHEFNLNDTELGLLTGISFSLFFGIAGIPLGVAADRVSRRNLLTGCMTIWSGATMACGMAIRGSCRYSACVSWSVRGNRVPRRPPYR